MVGFLQAIFVEGGGLWKFPFAIALHESDYETRQCNIINRIGNAVYTWMHKENLK